MPSFGRTLADFLDPISNALPLAEERLCNRARRGETCSVTEGTVIRAGFIRFLLLGGDAAVPIHESGVGLAGATIAEPLDLDEAQLTVSLRLLGCKLLGGLILTDASIKNLLLMHCVVKPIPAADAVNATPGTAIYADRVKAGSIFIRTSFVEGRTAFTGATISGSLDCSSSRFRYSADQAAQAHPERLGVGLDLSGAAIGTDLVLSGRFEDQPSPAEDPEGHPPATPGCTGRILLNRVKLGGDLRVERFRVMRPPGSSDCALNCFGVTVPGGFFMQSNDEIEGVALVGAKVGTLCDDWGSWVRGAGRHRFNGFVYDRFADEARDVNRKSWLLTQRYEDLGEVSSSTAGLRRQPWTQVAKTLDSSGDAKGAKQIRVAMERQATQVEPIWRALWGYPYDALCGYGYEPLRLLAVTLIAYGIGVGAVDHLASRGQFAATDKKVRESPAYKKCIHDGQAEGSLWEGYCPDIREPDYPPLYPWLYSADNLLPVIKFGQTDAWKASAHASGPSWILLGESLFGLFAASALVGVLGSFIVRKVS